MPALVAEKRPFLAAPLTAVIRTLPVEGCNVPQLGHRRSRIRCGGHERPLFWLRRSVPRGSVPVTCLLHPQSWKSDHVCCGLEAVIRREVHRWQLCGTLLPFRRGQIRLRGALLKANLAVRETDSERLRLSRHWKKKSKYHLAIPKGQDKVTVRTYRVGQCPANRRV